MPAQPGADASAAVAAMLGSGLALVEGGAEAEQEAGADADVALSPLEQLLRLCDQQVENPIPYAPVTASLFHLSVS